MKIELKTSIHSEYSSDTVTFENSGYDEELIKINHEGAYFEVKKSELRKVLTVFCEN